MQDLDNTISDIFFHNCFKRAGGNTPSNTQVDKFANDFAEILKDACVGRGRYTARWLREDYESRL